MKANGKKANYSIHNVLKSKFYHKQEYHTCELQCFVLHVCCKNVCIFLTANITNKPILDFFFIFLERRCLYVLTGLIIFNIITH